MRLAYGICAGPSDKFEKIAKPAILAIDANASIFVRRDQSSIFEAYNSILDQAVASDIDALVLIHDDIAILDSHVEEKLTKLFEDQSIGIVGVIGASRVRSLKWWNYEAKGRASEDTAYIDYGGGTHDVEVADGILLALGRQAIRQLRFDTRRYNGFHGYDADICFQAQSYGMRVVVAEIDLHHHTGIHGRVTNVEKWKAAEMIWQEKWGRHERLPSRLYWKVLRLTTRRRLGVKAPL